jgi:hypothetical protein
VALGQYDSVYHGVYMRKGMCGTPFLQVKHSRKEIDLFERRLGMTDLSEQKKWGVEYFQDKLSEKFLDPKTKRQSESGSTTPDDFYEDLS